MTMGKSDGRSAGLKDTTAAGIFKLLKVLSSEMDQAESRLIR